MSDDGGPIAKLATRSLNNSSFESLAYLDEKFRPEWLQRPKIYGNADGAGTHSNELVASYIAISEAIERWAFYESSRSANREQLGFHIDDSTSGMAAYPAFTSRRSREQAYLEAVERWSITAWWEGKIGIKEKWPISNDFNCYILSVPFSSTEVALLHKIGDINCYGFAAARKKSVAIEHANIELQRNVTALSSIGPSFAIEVATIYEQRLLYFGGPQGRREFEKKVIESSSRPPGRAPELLVDSLVNGPWLKYAKVWRCLFSPVSEEAFSNSSRYFLF